MANMIINSKEHLKLFCDGLSGEYQELFQDRTDWYERVMVNYDDYDDLEEDDVFPQEEKYEMLGRIMQEINYGQFLPHFCHDFPEFIKKSKVRNKPKEYPLEFIKVGITDQIYECRIKHRKGEYGTKYNPYDLVMVEGRVDDEQLLLLQQLYDEWDIDKKVEKQKDKKKKTKKKAVKKVAKKRSAKKAR
jgi:hypothetical protein